jgi:hypothetical protein
MAIWAVDFVSCFYVVQIAEGVQITINRTFRYAFNVESISG